MIFPIAAVIAIFSTDFEIDVPEFQRLAVQNLTPEQRTDLQFIEDTGNAIQAALTARGQEKRLKEALVLFLFALGDFAHEPGFAEKLAGFTARKPWYNTAVDIATLVGAPAYKAGVLGYGTPKYESGGTESDSESNAPVEGT